ncbi:Histone-lysine N-methyltransferase SETMAR [Ooceraea biroi]|uniref:Histone-lysine N-methyltransferase SETMAR n=1 Tax=Ooceraea biroi TaxID=2015173 RepID=A0A026W2K7_OOCBI|nr:Histone-lysine N-methyltransferase SETMAR [Ooceraea biroi]
MLFFYRKGKNASQVTNSICSVYGEGALAERTVRKWFAKFRAGDFNLKDQERSGRPSTTDDDQIKTLIENNPRYTTRELAEILKISKTTVHDHVVKLGYVSRYDVWVPHNLAGKRPELANRKGVVFHRDNARPHVSLTTRQKLLEFGWDVLPHPPYSPDIAPSDFHLFRSVRNSLSGKNFDSLIDIKNHLEEFFVEKPKKFWENGIFQLRERWTKVVKQNGAYISQ